MTTPLITAARLDYTADGTPCSTHFNDVYHATDGGLDQARHVFIAGNQLPARWQQRDSFTILETGFGLGLNFLATWQAWRDDPQHCARLHFISTELHPFTAADLHTLHQRWPELAELAAELQANWPPLTAGFHQLLLDNGRVTLTLLLGDATQMLPELQGLADAIYLDGFAPQKNPQLWSADFLALLSPHAAPSATLASWCVMGEVRQALAGLGWQIKKKPGYGRKWQMLSGVWNSDAVVQAAPDKTALVIGAGIAGCSTAEALARRGWQVALIDRHAGAAQEASGNPAGLLHPMLSRDDNLATRFSRAGYLYALRLLQRLQQAGHAIALQACGIVELADEVMTTSDLPADFVQAVTQAQASELAGLPVPSGGYWFPHGVALHPASLCAALLAEVPALITHWHSSVARIAYLEGQWHAYAADERCIAKAAHLVLANADDAKRLLSEIETTLRPIRGQVTFLPALPLAGLKTALCGSGYVTPPWDGQACLGASFVEDDAGTEVRESEHVENLQRLQQLLPTLNLRTDLANGVTKLNGRVAFRTATHDRLPLVGSLPKASFRTSLSLPRLPRQAGLHALLGLGSRGLIWAPLGAELLAAQMNGEALPVEQALSKALDPARFHLRKLRRV